jgi:predicted esterase
MTNNCMLVRREVVAPNGAAAVLLALHGHGGGVGQLEPLGRVLGSDLAMVLPQAWRTLHIHGMDEAEDPGHSWFFNFADDSPEPATYGDCLMELENLVYDIRERHSSKVPIIVVGIDQGAVLALGLCGVVPDYLVGVAAIGGNVPKIKGWTPPFADFMGLPALLIRDDAATQESDAVIQRDMQDRNATVTLCRVDGVLKSPLLAAASLRRWMGPLLRARSSAALMHDCAAVED